MNQDNRFLTGAILVLAGTQILSAKKHEYDKAPSWGQYSITVGLRMMGFKTESPSLTSNLVAVCKALMKSQNE